MYRGRVAAGSTLLADGRVLIVGGCCDETNAQDSATGQLYDPAGNVFGPTGSMTRRGENVSVVRLKDGRALVSGADIFDPATGSFSPVAGPRSSAAVLLEDGRVLMLDSGEGWIFDPATGGLGAVTPMADASRSYFFSAVGLADDRVLIAGGVSGNDALASAELFDPATNAFTAIGSMTQARLNPQMVRLQDGRVLIVGGCVNLKCTSSAELYDPGTGAFTATGSMAQSRGGSDGFTATLLANGRVLVAGGYYEVPGADGPQRVSLASAELYDPVIGAFRPAGSMATARWGHTATLLADGRVLVAGGSFAPGKIAPSAELYQP